MRILALICAFLLISAPTAHAGNWAVTYLDPPPSIEPKATYTVGIWVLQHGTHPYVGENFGKTGLKFRSGTGETTFGGHLLGEPGHYAVSFTLPEGTYEVFGVQGVFQDHPLGTLTVPGTFLIKPVDSNRFLSGDAGVWPWQDIVPPIEKPGVVTSMSPAPAAAVAPAADPEPAGEPVPVWVVGLVVVGAAGLFVLLRRRLRPAARR
ncbi:hypothetical protein ACIA8G_42680 [Lentzea sp. NPDC051213]|uniref:hypothetical protein n=1 Tax=Lentzea sp. NPDC051213 TaxID=3364126 RepID=UPI00378A541D